MQHSCSGPGHLLIPFKTLVTQLTFRVDYLRLRTQKYAKQWPKAAKTSPKCQYFTYFWGPGRNFGLVPQMLGSCYGSWFPVIGLLVLCSPSLCAEPISWSCGPLLLACLRILTEVAWSIFVSAAAAPCMWRLALRKEPGFLFRPPRHWQGLAFWASGHEISTIQTRTNRFLRGIGRGPSRPMKRSFGPLLAGSHVLMDGAN